MKAQRLFPGQEVAPRMGKVVLAGVWLCPVIAFFNPAWVSSGFSMF